MTSLLNGQAVKIVFGSTSVTAHRGSRLFNVRAQLAPAKPPPITTTFPAASCASAGRNDPAAQAATARNRRRVSGRTIIAAASWFLPRIPVGDGRDFGLREALGDPVHHRGGTLARAKIAH